MFIPSFSSRARVWVPATIALVIVTAAVSPVGAQDRGGRVVHLPPVTAPIAEPFRPPEHPFGPGNRGLTYDTEPGTEVRASADGEVVFAGRVAWDLHVTVLHADGVRTSYSFLAETEVVVGQSVQQGDPIGLAGDRFHFGARRGDEYFDPASLFGQVDVEVELLPFEVAPGSTPDAERAALWQFNLGEGGGWSLGLPGIALPELDSLAGWLTDRGQLVHHYTQQLNPLSQRLDLARALQQRLLFPPECTEDGEPRAFISSGKLALTVGGLGSNSESASIDRLDLTALGYSPEDVVRFSYAGGHTPATGGEGFTSLEASTYERDDTEGDLNVAAERLVEAIEATATERPEATIDVFAHSMGGVVLRLALLELEGRGFPLERLGTVATLGSPHEGANLATMVQAANTTMLGKPMLEKMEQVAGTGLDPDGEGVSQLSQTSELIAALREAGVPEGVELLSIAGRGDLVVPAPQTELTGARNVTVPEMGRHAHSDLVASDFTARELGLALAGKPQRCVGLWDHLGDEITGRGISYTQDLVGLGLLSQR